MAELVSIEDVEAARERIEGVAHRTPLDSSGTFAEMSGAESVHLKLENLQRTGSYKIRGAYNCISQLSEAERERGVIASSGGNHAQGVAWAARELGVDATIVMPDVTPSSKVEATKGYGADVVIHGEIYEECHQRALELAAADDLTFVPPFDHRAIIAGQATVGMEILDDLADVDTVVAAIGGGGLISGVSTAVKARSPGTRVVGVQTEGASHIIPSLSAGEIQTLDGVDTIAEGMAASRTGETAFAHIEERVDEVVAISDEAVTAGVALLAERAKVVAESAGAAATAAVLSDALDVTGERVAVVVSGGNLDLRDHARYCRRGLAHLDRYLDLRVAVKGWPGGLTRLVEVVEDADGEVDDVERLGPASDVPPNRHAVGVGVAVTGSEHAERVLDAVSAARDIRILN